MSFAFCDAIRHNAPARYMPPVTPNSLPDLLLSEGRTSFTLAEAKSMLDRNDDAVRTGLARLARKGAIFSPSRSFYVVIPPEYRLWGAVPAAHFIDPLMRFLDRTYYVALLSAAEMHGAAHQAPQVFQAMVDQPLRDRDFGRVRLRLFTSAHVIDAPVERRNVPTGTVRLATRELTAVDLVERPGNSGGIDNVATVLTELGQLDGKLLAEVAAARSRSVARRLGWLLTFVGADVDLDPLRDLTAVGEGEPTDLRAGAPRRGPVDRAWHVRVNVEVQPDL
jgi:predicted transcriptional regulator of viral defense system